MFKKKVITLITLLICASTAWTTPYNIVTIKTKTATSAINIQYPQGFSNKAIDLKIRELIDKEKEPYLEAAPLEDYPSGKDWIKANFKIKTNTARVLSILFNFKTYGRGAAHSNVSIRTLNFIDGQEVTLKQLFKPNSDYLSIIANYCYASLLKQGFPDDRWLKAGSKPTKANYSKWYFNRNGLVIVFDTEQITNALSGPTFVTIPYTILNSWSCFHKTERNSAKTIG